ncbi:MULTISPECIES: glycosyltransferase family 2 protein [Bacteria]|uniref:glycosyltransferase family 2 protein n=1 Tax=Bacteria TaxID=2 RepID=UPI00115DF900|nr:glycosyltransferase family 2 protein [Enterococcus casseliflavus]MBZ0322587.1 glycosyltransferase family 2 protein [Enterococcus casseliflavus]WBY93188.1 glycosyltransferase family 2 protein [Enterococcus casseliflavus]
MSFSIIIPHYNSVDTLEELLNTIPQSRKIETIVVDDNSDFPNLEKLEIMKKKFNEVLFLENTSSNNGAGACRNIGLKYANNEWVLFADSDDLFDDNFFEIISDFESSCLDLVFFPPKSFSAEEDTESLRHVVFEDLINNFLNSGSKLDELKLRYYYVVPWSKMMKRDLIKKNNILFEEIKLSNDILFSAKVGFFSQNLNVDDRTIYKVRHSQGSMTSIVNKERFMLRLNAWLDYVDFLNNHLSREEIRLLNISGTPKLIEAHRANLNVIEILKILKIIKKHDIDIIDKRIFNLHFLIKKIFKYSRIWRNENKYLKKE